MNLYIALLERGIVFLPPWWSSHPSSSTCPIHNLDKTWVENLAPNQINQIKSTPTQKKNKNKNEFDK